MGELGLTIRQLVEQNLPAGFSVSEDYLDTQLKIWQILMYKNAGVSEDNKFIIDAYSDEWQLLLGYLITWNIYQRIIASAFTSSLGISTDTSSKGQVKKITTGPTEVEFHDAASSLADIIKALSGPEGLISQLMGMACPLGSILGVQLPFCPQNGGHVCFKIARPRKQSDIAVLLDKHGLPKPKSMG